MLRDWERRRAESVDGISSRTERDRDGNRNARQQVDWIHTVGNIDGTAKKVMNSHHIRPQSTRSASASRRFGGKWEKHVNNTKSDSSWLSTVITRVSTRCGSSRKWDKRSFVSSMLLQLVGGNRKEICMCVVCYQLNVH